MKNKALALAIAAAVAAPSIVWADAKIYGRIYAELADEDVAGVTLDDDQGASRIGFWFDEKLGGGLTAYGNFEYAFDPADGDALTARNGEVGLKGDFGSVALGSFTGIYKSYNIDPFNETGMEARGKGGQSNGTFGHSGFFRNAIQYKTPELGGFSAAIQYSPDETGGDNGADGDYMLGLKYDAKIFNVYLATNSDDSEDDTNWKIGAQVKMGALTAGLQYEQVEINRAGFGGNEGDFWFGTVGYKLGNLLLAVNLGQFSSDVDNTDADYFALGGRYDLSKRTMVYAGYRETDADVNSRDDDVFLVGLRHDF